MFLTVVFELSIKSPCLWAFFHPYTLSQWYTQSNESFQNISMKISVEVLRKKERQDETQFRLLPKLVEKLDCSQVFRLVKFSFLVMRLMAYYAEIGHSHSLIV